MKPLVELTRDTMNVPMVWLHNLGAEHLKLIYNAMIVNGNEHIHHVRSGAQAHVGTFDTFDGTVTIHVYGEGNEFFEPFLRKLSEMLGVTIPMQPKNYTLE